MKKDIIQICLSAILLACAAAAEHFLQLPQWSLLIFYLVPYLIVGAEVLHEAAEKIADGNVFSEDFLMSIATLGAFAIGFMPGGENEMAEAVFVMLFFKVGECFEEFAEGRSRDSISNLMEMKADVAHVVRNGVEQDIEPEELNIGDVVVVRPGERIPIDGIVISGTSALNTVALTGESEPRTVEVGSQALSGCVNTSNVITIKVDKPYSESTVAKVMHLVEEADAHKSHSETFIARFARVYTPIVVFTALFVAFIPPFFSDTAYVTSLTTWLNRALTFLVVSCPCALVISVPLTFFGGIGGASRKGILIKGSSFIDALANLDTVVFDKTGTLTHGSFQVTTVCPQSMSESELLSLAALVERHSTHPIAAALVSACRKPQPDDNVTNQEELPGLGLCATVNNRQVAVGNVKLMEKVGAKVDSHDHVGTIVHIAIDGVYAGHIVVADTIKPDSADAIADLKRQGVRKTVMLTGDRAAVADHVAADLHLDEWHSDLMPADKVAHVERLISERPTGKTLAFVGDGINDTPVLTLSDVGIAMGALGSDAAIEAADVVLMDDKPSKVAEAIKIARYVLSIARQNVVFAIGVKVAVLVLATFGLAGMGTAVFADVGVTVLAVLNAMRALRS